MKDLDRHLMSSKESKILVEEYDKTNYAEINSNREPGKPDSKMYTLELHILRANLDMIEIEMEQRGIENKGVRVTMGKYPLKSDDPKVNVNYLGYQTIFFSAVDLDENGKNSSLAKSENQEKGAAADIPDMNYLHLTPPW